MQSFFLVWTLTTSQKTRIAIAFSFLKAKAAGDPNMPHGMVIGLRNAVMAVDYDSVYEADLVNDKEFVRRMLYDACRLSHRTVMINRSGRRAISRRYLVPTPLQNSQLEEKLLHHPGTSWSQILAPFQSPRLQFQFNTIRCGSIRSSQAEHMLLARSLDTPSTAAITTYVPIFSSANQRPQPTCSLGTFDEASETLS
jgi:hypothetical protein